MFNNYTFNEATFNQVPKLPTTAPQDSIVYNWFWLSNENFVISNHDFDNWHAVDSKIYNNPVDNLWGELNYYVRGKIITLVWVLKADTAEELNTLIDTTKKVLLQNNKDLDIKVNWTIRRAKASCINLDSIFTKQHFNITFVPFVIQFRVISQFFSELTSQSVTLLWKTAWFTEEVVNYWTVNVEPRFIFVFNSATSVTQLSVTVWDNVIKINETISSSDTIIIDCKQKTITINSSEVDYDWTFPNLAPWSNNYNVAVNWTKNFDLTITYFNNYL